MSKHDKTPKMAIEAISNADWLADLHASAFVEGAWSKAAFADLLAQKTIFALGCADGFVLLQKTPDGMEILTLAVRPDKRRRGLARRLMAYARDAFKPKTIWLDVAADNQPAQALYTALGFNAYGRRSKYYKRAGNLAVDAVLMRLEIEEGATDE